MELRGETSMEELEPTSTNWSGGNDGDDDGGGDGGGGGGGGDGGYNDDGGGVDQPGHAGPREGRGRPQEREPWEASDNIVDEETSCNLM